MVAVEATPETFAYHKANFASDPRVTSIHAAAVSAATYEASPTVTFRIAPQGNNWRNCVDKVRQQGEASFPSSRSGAFPGRRFYDMEQFIAASTTVCRRLPTALLIFCPPASFCHVA
eukprot:SAG11_NODE_1904_length_4088_cov_3.427676_5_plen_117_part_00